MSGIVEQIAAKRAELAAFVASSAAAVLTEQMSEETRGIVALDLLRLMVASGLTPAAPMIDVTPDKPAAIAPAPVAESPAKAAKAPKPATGSRGRPRKFTDEQLLAAVREHGNDTQAIADLFGSDPAFVNKQRRRLGVPSKKGWKAGVATAAKARAARAAKTGATDVQWTTENVEKLRDMVMQSPRPSNATVAAAFGTSVSAIQTAMSRNGVTKGVIGSKAGVLKDLSSFQKRGCMTCSKPFLSEGKHNRMCPSCRSGSDDVGMAA